MGRGCLLSLSKGKIPCKGSFTRAILLFFLFLTACAIWALLGEKIACLAFLARAPIRGRRLFWLQAAYSFDLYWLVLLTRLLLLVFNAREQRKRQRVALLTNLCVEVLRLESAWIWWRGAFLIKLRAHAVHQLDKVERHCISLGPLHSKLLEVFDFFLTHLKLLLKFLLKSMYLSKLVCLLRNF